MRYCLKSPCPVCQSEIEYKYQTEDIPFFSDILITTALCECGYRFTDTIILGEGDPVRWSIDVQSADDLNVRVVRSSRGTIRLPELGITIEPGPACEACITNIEGILWKIREIVENIQRSAGGEERERSDEVLMRIDRALAGTLPFTFILEDPSGNSAIISDTAERELMESETT